MTMISDLPSDLLSEIVSKVPLKSMRAVRLTCTKWNSLSKSESFTKMHIGKTTEIRKGESRMVVLMNCNLYLMNIFVDDVVDPSIESICKISCLNEQVKISQVFHCKGLLLCILKEDATNVVVWNPYLGQTSWIGSRYSHRPEGWDKFIYALGYENKNSYHSYKFLRFIDYYYLQVPEEDRFLWYEIYDFDSGLWTTLDVNPHWGIMYGHDQRGVSLNGNTYWCATERNSEDRFGDHIICFDFTKERFGPLLRLPFNVEVNDDVTLSCVREEKLAALLQHNEVNTYEIDIWITTKIEAENVSWSKFLTVDTEPYIPISSNSFFIDEEKKIVMGFEEYYRKTFQIIGESGYFRELELGKRVHAEGRRHVCSYVPSLVQIKQPPGDIRKQQSDLEQLRYDQNLLRLVALKKRLRQ